MTPTDLKYLEHAYDLARQSYDEGGIPIGSVLVSGDRIIGAGHNRRVQEGDPIAHGEMDAIRKAGRQPNYAHTTLYTSLSPCMMCAGTIVQFRIPRVVIGENKNFGGNEDFLRRHGVEVVVVNHEGCTNLMRKFISERPRDWYEDIGDASIASRPAKIE
jgi:cytosine deaminase